MSSIGQKYFDSLANIRQDGFAQGLELLSPSVKKTVNLEVVCTNRDQVGRQMQDLLKFGIKKIKLLELIEVDNKIILRLEITYDDNTIEAVISVLTTDDQGLIEEINQVFGEKGAYQWQLEK